MLNYLQENVHGDLEAISKGQQMTDYLDCTFEKFTFRVATDRLYTIEGMWILEEEGRVRVGISDFLQQRSGDIAFVEIYDSETELQTADEIADIETIKVDITLQAPVSGKLVGVNSKLELEPELINEDPYGEGWLVVIEPSDWSDQRASLLDPQAYYEHIAEEVERETKES